MPINNDSCFLHLAPSGQGGTVTLNHEYRLGKRYMKYSNSDKSQEREIYTIVFIVC